MDTKETIKEIKAQFRLFMNGVVSQSMREKGLDYKLNFGIELPRIKEIAAKFRMVGEIEKAHEERYLKLVERVEKGEVFEREGVKVWKCINCGHLHVGAKAPKVCPTCNHPQSYFEVHAENY